MDIGIELPYTDRADVVRRVLVDVDAIRAVVEMKEGTGVWTGGDEEPFETTMLYDEVIALLRRALGRDEA